MVLHLPNLVMLLQLLPEVALILESNFALRLAVDKAKSANMPMANIQRSIDRVRDKSASQLEEVIYEGYGPGGVAILVEAATDNLNRTYPGS